MKGLNSNAVNVMLVFCVLALSQPAHSNAQTPGIPANKISDLPSDCGKLDDASKGATDKDNAVKDCLQQQYAEPDYAKPDYAKLSSSWTSLFNGKDLSGWTPKFKGYPVGQNLKNTFRIEDGLLTVSYDQWSDFQNDEFGHLFTNQAYRHYKIRVEYRFVGEQITNAPQYQWAYRNNGVMLHSPPAEDMALEQTFPLSGESQLLGGNGTDPRSTGNFCSPSTNIVQNGELIKTHCLNSNSPTYHGDQWVVFEVEARDDGSVKHFVNGELVFAYDQLQVDPEDEYGKRWLAAGKPLVLKGGHISIQAETHPIQFRSIAIRSLD